MIPKPLLPNDVEIKLLGHRAVCVDSELRGNQWYYGFEIPTHTHIGVHWYSERNAFRYLTPESFSSLGL